MSAVKTTMISKFGYRHFREDFPEGQCENLGCVPADEWPEPPPPLAPLNLDEDLDEDA